MPADQFKRVNLDYIYPPFRDRLFDVIARCNSRGAKYVATLGFRTYEEQDQLFRLGRDIPGKKVTNARGGQSQHCFGLAIDFVHDIDATTEKVEPGWAPRDYAILIDEVNKAGLHTGVKYNDRPHVGWPRFYRGQDLQALDAVWKSLPENDALDMLKVVWQHVDAQGSLLPQY